MWGDCDYFLTFLHLGSRHWSSNFNILPLLIISHHAEFVRDEKWLFLHFPLSALVIYLVKVRDLFRP